MYIYHKFGNVYYIFGNIHLMTNSIITHVIIFESLIVQNTKACLNLPIL